MFQQVGNFFSGMVDGINDVATKVFEAVLVLLPTSPFQKIQLDPIFVDFLGYFNYYFPMKTLLTIGLSWCGCIATYYAYQLILRSIKAVS